MMLKRLLIARATSSPKERVISLTTLGPIGAELRNAGIEVDCLELDKSVFGVIRRFFQLVKLLNQLQPDVVQTWMYHADLFGGLAAKLAGCRQIMWGIRGTYTPIGRPATHKIMQLCALLSGSIPSKIVCVAEAARKSHITYGYRADKLLVIPNGLDFHGFQSASARELLREQWLFNDKNMILGSVGRFHPDKGQDLLIEAFASLAAEFPLLCLVLVGRDCEASNQQLGSQIAKLQLTGRVLLLGERSDISACLGAFDLYCMPSRTEGFPNGLAEAMAVGLAAVATKAGDAEVLGADTVLYATPDVNALAVALRDLLTMDAGSRQQLGANAAMRVKELFSIQAVRQRYDRLYQSVLES
ncbi:glycosyltransferase [Rheinheimera riviphila]|uniref:Glycosyltransferase n=1 Tax=Rheinheimera riviphila TaxID=1834037 RepID=A0A437R3D7_9GAMM|nr:glycosyltransferase [Rheinheimera riviphila]